MKHIARLAPLLSGLLCAACSAAPGAEGLCRHWGPFIRTGESGAYVSATLRDGTNELWKEAQLSTNAFDFGIVVKRGAALTNLGPATVVFRSAQIDDVFTAGALAPQRNFSRTFVDYFQDVGYVASISTLRGEYQPGQVPLQPALALSSTGQPDTWRYLGHLSGEPATLTPPGRPRVWSDGGGLVRLEDGRWRAYLNGYGPALAAAEAETLKGPWRFLRDADGRLRELAGALPLREKLTTAATIMNCFHVFFRTY